MYTNILVINLMHIGDLLLVTPVLKTLRTNYPNARISLLADKKLSDLVVHNRHIDEYIAIDKKGYHDKLAHYLEFIGQIRKRKFDLVVNLHQNERASFIAALSGAKKIVGYSTWGPHLFFDKVMKNTKAVKHQIHSHFDVLREAVGVEKIDDGGLEMWLDDASTASANRIWEKTFGGAPLTVVGLNIGASWETKRWCGDYYAELADRLLERGYGVVYFGGPMDVEIVEAAVAKMRQAEHEHLKILTGKLSLQELAALLKRCAVFVTNDSGPMHIAVTQDVPVVTMFGASPVPGFYPYNEISVLVKTPAACHPCGVHTCETLECMKRIPVDVVFDYTMQALEKYGGFIGNVPRAYGQYQCKIVEL